MTVIRPIRDNLQGIGKPLPCKHACTLAVRTEQNYQNYHFWPSAGNVRETADGELINGEEEEEEEQGQHFLNNHQEEWEDPAKSRSTLS